MIVLTKGLSTLSIKASSLIWPRLAQQNIAMSVVDHALVVDKHDDILVRLAPEPAALFIVLRPVDDPNAGLGGEHLQHRRQLSAVRTPDVGPRALNGGRELKHADISRLGLGVQQELDAVLRRLARDQPEKPALRLGVDRLVP